MDHPLSFFPLCSFFFFFYVGSNNRNYGMKPFLHLDPVFEIIEKSVSRVEPTSTEQNGISTLTLQSIYKTPADQDMPMSSWMDNAIHADHQFLFQDSNQHVTNSHHRNKARV